MFFQSNQLNLLLSFVRSISKSSEAQQNWKENQRSALLLDSFFKQIDQSVETNERFHVDQRLENLLLALAYLAVQLDERHPIRADVVQRLLRVYQRLPTGTYYEIPTFKYRYHLPPAEVFSFSLHTSLTELAATSTDNKFRKHIVDLMGKVIREFVENLCQTAIQPSEERCRALYRYEGPFLFGALRSIGRISSTDQSLISQLFPTNFVASTESIDFEKKFFSQQVMRNIQTTLNQKAPAVAPSANFISMSEELHRYSSSVTQFDLCMSNKEIPASSIYFYLPTSTYYPRRQSSDEIFDRLHPCVTVSTLEQFYETLKLIDHRVIEALDQIVIREHQSIHRTHFMSPIKSYFPYTYFGELFIVGIIKFFRDNLQQLYHAAEYQSSSRSKRLSSATKSIYLFVQQLISMKLLDLNPNDYEQNPQRYRTRVDGNAAALELLSFSCNDQSEAEKLCAKCAEKFSQEFLPTKLIAIQMPLLITSLEILPRLAEKYQVLATYSIRALADFLLEPGAILSKISRVATQTGEPRVQTMFEKLRDTAINSLCKCLLIRSESDATCVEALLVQLSAKLILETAQEIPLGSYNAILTMSQIAMTLQQIQNTQHMISARFQQCLGKVPMALEILLIDQLAHLLAFSQSLVTYDEIMRFFTEQILENAYPVSTEINQRSQAVIKALAHMALNLENSSDLMNLLTNILEIFVQVASKVKYNEDKSKNKPNIQNLLDISLVIAIVFDRLPKIDELSQRVFRLIQRFWFYCVLYDLHLDTKKLELPPVYRESFRLIAIKSPPLVNQNVSDEPLKAVMPLKSGQMTKQDHAELKSQLHSIFSSYAIAKTYIDRFNVEQTVYTLAVYYLETYRVRHSLEPSAFQCIFSYLEDPGIIRDKYKLWTLIAAVGRKCFEIFLNEMDKMPKGSERNHHLEQQFQFLMVKRAHVQNEVREEAKYHLHSLLLRNSFSHLFCSSVVIETLMNIINILVYSLNDDNVQKVAAHHRVPKTEHTIQFADTHEKRSELLYIFIEFGRTFVEQGLSISPTLLKSCIQQFMLKLEHGKLKPDAARQHKGLHIMWEYFTTYSRSTDSKRSFYRTDFADHIISLSERSAAIGFVERLDRENYPKMMNDLRYEMQSAIDSRLHSFEKYQSLNQRRRRMSSVAPINTKSLTMDFQDRLAVFDNTFRNALFKLTAMLISNVNETDDLEAALNFPLLSNILKKPRENPLDREMIHNLIGLPVKMFTTSVMEAAIDCWSWALVARPELELLIVEEIYKAWEKLISDRQGLYSIDQPESSPLAPLEKDRLKIKSSSINPHRFFLKFIEERLYLSMSKTGIEMEILVDLLHKSLGLISSESSIPMSQQVAAVGLRFRLLKLALYLVQSDYFTSPLSKALLREKIYHTAFDYFTVHHHCPTETSNDLRNDIRKMIQFFSLVYEEKRFVRDSSVNDHANTTDLSITEPVLTDSPVSRRLVNTALSNNLTVTESSLDPPKSVNSHRSPSPVRSNSMKQMYTTNSDRHLSHVLLKKRDLLLILLAYEIERLETFHNPLGRSELQFDSDVQSVYKNWRLYDLNNISNKRWRQYAHLAWQISPDLAVNLYQTVAKDSLRKEISSLIKANPLQVRHIPDALSIFTSSIDQDRQCATSHILTWAAINPVAALSYFASTRLKQVSNPYTIQYASRILCTTKPEALILYIPQIVQAVRYDQMGFVRRLILDLAKKSNLLAHQLIWNIRTNIYKNETTVDEDMQRLLGPIVQQIETALTPEARQFYERVFQFSDRLTKVSEKIKVYPKGIERKEACLSALREIGSEVPPGVYLPSNPEAIIVSLLPESGAPMQSAEKAPYRATFRVQTVGIEEVEHCGDPDYEFMQDFSQQYSQMAIFKVGDDVRQDILALQLMRLFQNIFEQEGLELYLYTYRVIATSPGCGVIECVPNSRSREDIGRNTIAGLSDYFRHLYGKEDSTKFQNARRNFVMSMAAYSVALFILQIKDRHNGNIMLDDDGHIIHIDFGFMFESSPGGNIGFEPDIKLTAEMILIMGDLNSPAFIWFKELCVKGYLALRPYRQHFLTLVALMLDTGLPCFRGKTLEQLNARFKPDASETDAARYMHEVINRCAHNLRTRLYDIIQFQQNAIPF